MFWHHKCTLTNDSISPSSVYLPFPLSHILAFFFLEAYWGFEGKSCGVFSSMSMTGLASTEEMDMSTQQLCYSS